MDYEFIELLLYSLRYLIIKPGDKQVPKAVPKNLFFYIIIDKKQMNSYNFILSIKK